MGNGIAFPVNVDTTLALRHPFDESSVSPMGLPGVMR
jgi:hypothetical protein